MLPETSFALTYLREDAFQACLGSGCQAFSVNAELSRYSTESYKIIMIFIFRISGLSRSLRSFSLTLFDPFHWIGLGEQTGLLASTSWCPRLRAVQLLLLLPRIISIIYAQPVPLGVNATNCKNVRGDPDETLQTKCRTLSINPLLWFTFSIITIRDTSLVQHIFVLVIFKQFLSIHFNLRFF